MGRAKELTAALSNGSSGGFAARALESLPDDAPLSEHFDLVVQCTNLGHLPSDPPPLLDSWDRLVPPLVCAEVIHTPLETKFLAEARRRGCACHHGAHMLDKQIDAIVAFLTTREE